MLNIGKNQIYRYTSLDMDFFLQSRAGTDDGGAETPQDMLVMRRGLSILKRQELILLHQGLLWFKEF